MKRLSKIFYVSGLGYLILVPLFSCSTSGDRSSGFSTSTKTGSVQKLKKDRNDTRAEVSPDGRWIAFTSRDAETRSNYSLYVVSVDGEHLRRLLFYEKLMLKAPKWSPDGKKIAFSRTDDQNVDIFLINRDGTGLQQLTTADAADAEPAWSPDGAELIFHSNRSGRYQLYRMAANGDNQRLLIKSEFNDYIPDWSRDNRISFSSDRSGSMDIWVMNADGSGLLQITSFPEREIAPVWSSDGSTLAFHHNIRSEDSVRTWNWDVYVVNPDGTGLKRVTVDEGEDLFATWFPDRNRLLVPSQREGGLFRMFRTDISKSSKKLSFNPVFED